MCFFLKKERKKEMPISQHLFLQPNKMDFLLYAPKDVPLASAHLTHG